MSESTPRRRNHALWLGPLVAFVGAVSYFLVFARFPVLRDFPWVNLPFVLVGLAIAGLGVWRAYGRPDLYRGKILGPISFGVAFLLAGALCAYVFWLSYMLPAPTDAAMSARSVPDFVLLDQDGHRFDSVDLRGRKVVLTFFRGHW